MNETDKIRLGASLRKQGLGWKRAAKAVGHSEDWLRQRLDPEYLEQRRARIRRDREALKGARGALKSYYAAGLTKPMTEREYKDWLAEQPEDTRDITGRLMGDPRWGRSALDQRSMGDAQA